MGLSEGLESTGYADRALLGFASDAVARSLTALNAVREPLPHLAALLENA